MPISLLSLTSWVAGWLPAPLKGVVYHLGPLTRALRAALNRSAPQGISLVSVAGGKLQGARMALDMQSEKDYWLGTYEMPLQEAIQDWVKTGWTVFDVGANVGYVSLLLARQVGAQGHVTAFEALPANVERLKTNLEINALADLITIVPQAVSRENGVARFQVGVSDDTGRLEGSAGRLAPGSTSIEVPTLGLDDYIYGDGHAAPQAIKMDIEGGEVLAIGGMRRLLKEARPLLMIEIHSEGAAEVVWGTLTNTGYKLLFMQKGYPAVKSVRELGRKAYVVARPGV